MQLGLRAYTMDGQQFRPAIEEGTRGRVEAKPDSFVEAKQKFALWELQQRVNDAGLACCELEYAS